MKNKIGSAILSILIAFGLWVYVITTVSPDSEAEYTDIPVTFVGETALEGRNLLVTSDLTASVALRLQGNRSDLTKVDETNITIKCDLSRLYDPGLQQVGYTISYPGDVPSNAFVVLNQYPQTITVRLEKKEYKEVPVEIAYEGAVPPGFMSDKENAVLDYNTVTVSGPSSVVEKIDSARIEVSLDDLTESIDQSYRFTLLDDKKEPVNASMIKTNVEEVHLQLKILRVKEVKLEVTVIDGGGATRETSDIKIAPQTIRLAGPEALLEDLDVINLGTINLGELTKATKLPFAITIPEGITNLTGVTEAEVNVLFSGLKTKEFTITAIESINAPEDLEVDIITEKLTVVVRGPAPVITKLSADDITLEIDFTNAVAGTTTYNAKVKFAPGFSSVGAVGSYSVTATLAEPEE